MTRVITVQVEGNRDILHFKSEQEKIKQNDYVIVKSLCGEELGKVIKYFGDSLNKIKNISCIPEILRIASQRDLDNFNKKKMDEKEAYDFCLKKIKEREIPIKLIRITISISINPIRTIVFNQSKITAPPAIRKQLIPIPYK